MPSSPRAPADPLSSLRSRLPILFEDHATTLASALATALDAEDDYTRNHSHTVSELSAQIASQLGLPADRVTRVGLAGLLHDIGKIGIPDSVLRKPGKLTGAEYRLMQTHATLGHSIVSAVGLVGEALWVLHHHERIDGRGYPDGLAGDAIPLESRIIFVADAFEAITSDRPYRRGRSETEALDELQRHAGTQFDSRCVAALCRALGHRSAVPTAFALGK
jgi:putative nucleotidyltransferase with HDIG domain